MTDTVWSKAADLIKRNGWARGSAQNEYGCLCAGGAIAMALGYKPEEMWDSRSHPEMKDAFNRFGDYVGAGHSYDVAIRVFDFNDASGRTEEEVINTLQELHEIEVSQ